MPDLVTSLLSIGSGGIVGLVLGLVGGACPGAARIGRLAQTKRLDLCPLRICQNESVHAKLLSELESRTFRSVNPESQQTLVYAVGVKSPHVAIGTSAMAVAASALGNLFPHWRNGNVKWACAAVFAAAGVLGAFGGASAAKAMDGQRLLALFGLVMIVVGTLMLRGRRSEGDPNVKLTKESAGKLVPALVAIGFTVGLFSGFFGIGGGFLIVPGLMFATGMPLTSAIGTSLFAVSAFGAATAASYAVSGFVDWPMAGLFVLGGLAGGVIGVQLGKILSAQKRGLTLVFGSLVIIVGIYVVARGFLSAAQAGA